MAPAALALEVPRLYAPTSDRVDLYGRVLPMGRLSMDATTLSPARLGRFEDEVRELRDVMCLGRDPSPWHDDAIRAAAGAVAGDCRGPRRRF